MAVAFVQGKAGEASSLASITVSPTSALTAGNLAVAMVGAFGETTANISVTDTLGNSWTKILTAWQADSVGSGGTQMNAYYSVLTTGGADGIKAQVSPSVNGFWGMTVAEFSGVGTPTIGVKGGAGAVETNPENGPTFTPSAGSLLCAFMTDEGNSETISAGAGWLLAASSGTAVLNNGGIYVLNAAGTATHAIWGTGQVGASQGNIYVEFIPGGGAPTDPFPAGYGHTYRAMGNYLSRL